MKRFIFSLLVTVSFSLQVHAQVAVFDAGVSGFLSAFEIERGLQWAETTWEWGQKAKQFKKMIESLGDQIDLAVQNLKSLKDIRSYSDFMDWYNRQLYFEKSAVQSFDSMNVSIGKKNYKLSDIVGIGEGLQNSYIDVWKEDFTEDQRRALWLKLGMTPANYAYVTPFRQKGRELNSQFFSAAGIQNDWYMRNVERNNQRLEQLAEDNNRETNDKLGIKEIAIMQLESSMENNKLLNDIAMNQALQMQMQATDNYLKNSPQYDPFDLHWKNGFEPLN
jgi:hypothetical protein